MQCVALILNGVTVDAQAYADGIQADSVFEINCGRLNVYK